ncbi:hypothetical protein PHMEG_000157 [Phytophthora megakarya]|uniref:Uncharacterized protein n=1 Tax=Phytophthora megakarya TaxID=4795 RepID=A0A225X4N0_9STRA|nr:hypothetical protein PHMEG_000157 [Phytophthora megakarya]
MATSSRSLPKDDKACPKQIISADNGSNVYGPDTYALAIKRTVSRDNQVMRRIHGEAQAVPTPELVHDYHRSMGGVDVHGQLRMQCCRIQNMQVLQDIVSQAFRHDNGERVMVYRIRKDLHDKHPKEKKCPAKHYVFFRNIHARERTAASPMCEEPSPQTTTRTTDTYDGHSLEENPGMRDNDQGMKHRQRSCQVCAIYKTKPRKYIKYFSPECST